MLSARLGFPLCATSLVVTQSPWPTLHFLALLRNPKSVLPWWRLYLAGLLSACVGLLFATIGVSSQQWFENSRVACSLAMCCYVGLTYG